MSLFFGKHIYRSIENTLNGKRPRLVHGPRAGPAPRGARETMVRCHAWDLCRMIYRSPSSHYDLEALFRVLWWAGSYLGLLKLLSTHGWILGH